MSDETVSAGELKALDGRVTDIVGRLNDVNRRGREYVDDANQTQDKALQALERKLVDLFDKKLQDHDRAIRKFIAEEAAKVSKAFKNR